MIDKNMVINWTNECLRTAKFIGSPIGIINTFDNFLDSLNKGEFDIHPAKCEWKLTENPPSYRERYDIKTSCGHTPSADGCFCKFCPFCGKETEGIEEIINEK